MWVNPRKSVQTLRYRGRVVNPGSFRWEPAVVQSTRAPELIRLSDAATLDIGAAAATDADPSDP